MRSGSPTVFTLGHATRSLTDLADVLLAYDVDLLVDVRDMPRSVHSPQFNSEDLEADLPYFGLGYLHLPGLGGARSTRAGSPNTGWRDERFRGYADHMLTGAFREAISELTFLAHRWRPAIMCAEAVPWRCHRFLVGDALVVRGVRVIDILDAEDSHEHHLTSFARVHGESIVYPEAG